MSNTNTSYRLTAAQMSPIVGPTAATPTIVQFNTAGQNNGYAAGNANLPIPGQYKAQNKRVHVRFNYSVLGATVGSQALTVTLSAVNNAATPVTTIIATTGAVNCATLGGADTIYLNLDAEWVEPAVGGSTVIRGGSISGTTVSTGVTVALVTAAVLTGQPTFTATNITGVGAAEGLDEQQYIQVAVTLAQTDATFTFTPLELSVEVL